MSQKTPLNYAVSGLKIASHEDFPVVFDFVHKFASASYPEFELEDYKISELVTSYFQDPEKRIVILALIDSVPVGMIAGVCSETQFNTEKALQETMWWFDEDRRNSRLSLELPRALEFWGRKLGARWADFCSVRGEHQEKVSKFYVRKGFQPLETHFLKDLQKCPL